VNISKLLALPPSCVRPALCTPRNTTHPHTTYTPQVANTLAKEVLTAPGNEVAVVNSNQVSCTLCPPRSGVCHACVSSRCAGRTGGVLLDARTNNAMLLLLARHHHHSVTSTATPTMSLSTPPRTHASRGTR
jgi:hypothetical protein